MTCAAAGDTGGSLSSSSKLSDISLYSLLPASVAISLSSRLLPSRSIDVLTLVSSLIGPPSLLSVSSLSLTCWSSSLSSLLVFVLSFISLLVPSVLSYILAVCCSRLAERCDFLTVMPFRTGLSYVLAVCCSPLAARCDFLTVMPFRTGLSQSMSLSPVSIVVCMSGSL